MEKLRERRAALAGLNAEQEERIRLLREEQTAGNFTTRAVPLFPEVCQAFMDYFESLPEGSPALIFGDVKFKSLRRKFQRALDRAGIPAWEKFFQNMRSTRETELAEKYPLQDVTAWLGNSPAVAQKHYLQVKSTNFQLASETKTIGHKKGQHCNVETCRNMNENEEAPCFTTPNALLNINLLESAHPHGKPFQRRLWKVVNGSWNYTPMGTCMARSQNSPGLAYSSQPPQ